MNRLIILISVLIGLAYFGMRGINTNIMHGDAMGYYMYLPSALIYNNLKHPETTPAKLDGVSGGVIDEIVGHTINKTPLGHSINQYTYGVALTEAPFFLIAHAWEKATGKQANGYSNTYVLWLRIAALVYCLLGLVIVYAILKKYFTPSISLFATIGLFFCTNLFWFAECQAGMSHTPLFFLYALLMLLTIRVHERPRTSLFIAIGFIGGLITIIRPTDILCLLIPLLYNVYSVETLREKLAFVRNHLKVLPLVIIAFLIPIIPQLLYWKAISGSYLFYSYGDQQFYWKDPKIIKGLFYFANGWLPYSPIMLFAVIGMAMYKRIKPWSWCLWALFPLYVYVIYSWYCYNYINGLGSRPMIHLYPILAIPLAAFMQLVSQQRVAIKALFVTICLFFFSVNISLSMLQQDGMILTEDGNFQFTKQMLYRSNLRYKDLVAKDLGAAQPDTGKLTKVYTLLHEHYDDSTSNHYVADPTHASKYVYFMGRDEEYLQPEPVIYDSKKYNGATWFKVSGRYMYINPSTTRYRKHGLMIGIESRDYYGVEIENKIGNWRDTTAKEISLEHYEPGKWGYVYFFLKIPRNIKDGDAIKIFTWNNGKGEIYVDDVRLDAYK